MNRRNFLKSTAALATVAVAGKASIEPVAAPALFDLGDPKISNGTFNEPIGDIVKRKMQEYEYNVAEAMERAYFAADNRVMLPPHVYDSIVSDLSMNPPSHYPSI